MSEPSGVMAQLKKTEKIRLGLAEQKELIPLAQNGDAAATDKLLKAHLTLILKLANKYNMGRGHLEDLINEGVLGFLQALQRYDPNTGATLATYARYRIVDFMYIYASEQTHRVSLSSTQSKWIGRMIRAEKELGGKPTNEEIAEKMDAIEATPNAVSLWKQGVAIRSVEIDGLEHEGLLFIDDDPGETIDEERISKALKELVRALPKRERLFIIRLFGLNGREPEKNYKVSESFGISESRGSQIRKQALRQLRELVRRS